MTKTLARFLAQARRTPDRVACRYGDGVLTYRQLEEGSAALAAVLEEALGEDRRPVAVYGRTAAGNDPGFSGLVSVPAGLSAH